MGFGSLDVRIIGIWGMGGIGKTTLTRVIFNRFSSQFEGSLFLENVKEEVKKHQPFELEKIIYSKLLNEKSLEAINKRVKQRLRKTKVLFVLDDVDNIDQLEYLPKHGDSFGCGSRIIVTTRDLKVINGIKTDGVYEVMELNSSDAHQLFYAKAFQGSRSPTDYMKLSGQVVTKHAKGNPLALKVLGCHFHSMTIIEEWKSGLEELESIPNHEIHNKLKISYDALSSNAQDIFLDITCFFEKMYKENVERILDCSYPGVIATIRVLINKSLISINEEQFLIMHDLVRKMGREIVRQQCCGDPGMRSRLWSTNDVSRVLSHDQVSFIDI